MGFCPVGFCPSGVVSYCRWLEASNLVLRKLRVCAIYVAKTKALVSCAVIFVFAYMQQPVFSLHCVKSHVHESSN